MTTVVTGTDLLLVLNTGKLSHYVNQCKHPSHASSLPNLSHLAKMSWVDVACAAGLAE